MEELNFIENLERKLLPQECYFSDEQRQIIFSKGNANIIAGPGSGKTTVLIAKIAYLMKHNIDSKGICVITHTNVAVDEVKTQLRKAGINSINHPHFIGTIHEFFNYFFSYKAYQELFPGKVPTLIEEDDYIEKFKGKFEEYRTDDYGGVTPLSKMKGNFLFFSQQRTVNLRFSCPNSYKHIMLKSLMDIIKNGELRHNDTLSLAEWYIDKYLPLLKKAFSSRFSWLILDEAQDTSKFQFELLNKIVDKDEMNYQRYGDPYQSLYNMYDNNSEDDWVPSSEEEVFQPLELSSSTRFGNSIANILKTTCIEKYSSFRGNPKMNSFKPHLIIYNNKQDVIPTYLKIIEEYYSSHNDFKDSRKKIAIVGSEHAHLRQYKNGYEKPKNIKVKTEGIMYSLYNVTLKGCYFYLKENNLVVETFSLKELINKVNDMMNDVKAMLSVVFREIIKNKGIYNEKSTKNLKKAFERILGYICSDGKVSHDLNSVLDYVAKESLVTYQTYATSEVNNNEAVSEEELFFGTVHAVKGETHKATLLIDSNITEFKFKQNEVSYNLVEIIFEYLTGDFVDYMSSDNDLGLQQATKKALKIAYVALSRPTHLACVAVYGNDLGDNLDYVLEKSTKFGWEVKVVQ